MPDPAAPSGVDFGDLIQPAPGLDLSGLVHATDDRSWFAKAWDALSQPIPPIQRFIHTTRAAGEELTRPTLADSVATARLKGAIAGLVAGGPTGGGLIETAGQLIGSPIGLALSAVPPLAAAAEGQGLLRAGQGLRAAEAALGVGMGARGLEQAAKAQTIPEAGEGLLQAALGAVGARSGLAPLTRAEGRALAARLALPAAPYVGTEAGDVLRPGQAMPVVERPDPSFVRGVPAEYARREPAGFLPAGRGFIAGEGGVIAPIEQAGALDLSGLVKPAASADVSSVRSVPAAPLTYEFQGQRKVPATFSGDVHAQAAPEVDLNPLEAYALRWIRQDMDAIPFTSKTFTEAGRGRGSDLEVTGGAAGAPIYRAIVGPEGRELTSAGRDDVVRAIDNLLAGKLTKTGDLILPVARSLAEGNGRIQRLMATPPPEVPLGPAVAGEEGAISPTLAARLGLGSAGAAYGAATGTDTEDRLKRAALFGAAGAIAPSLLETGTGAGALRAAPGLRPTTTGPIPPTEPIPRARLLDFPSLQKMPEAVRGDIADILEKNQGFEPQRRGVQPVARTEALADRITVPLETLKSGTALNAEELAAHKNAVASILTQRQPLVEKIQSGAATDVEKLQFSKLTDEATVLVANYRGAKAEAGRALNILRAKARVLEFGDQGFIEQALKAPGFNEDVQRVAAAAAEAAGDPVKQLQLLREAMGATPFQRAQSVYYANLLSGVKTHLRNFLGNSFNAMVNAVTPIASGPADLVRSTVTGADRSVYMGELGPTLVGTFVGVPQGLRDFAFTMRHGFSPATVERAALGKFDTMRAELPGGLVTNLPMRALEASDVAFRAIARSQEMYGAAYAQARTEGLTRWPAIQSRMVELLTGDSVLSQQLRQRADAFAARATFNEQPGAFTSSLMALKNNPNIPAPGRAALTFVMPFVRTPMNILRQGAEFGPLGFAMKATHQAGREGSQALGRAALGSLALVPLAYLAASGQLSGAGAMSPGERTAAMERGWRPNSVKIGNAWVNYQTFQPLSVALAAVANAWERFTQSDRSDRSADESATAALAGVARSFVDQSFMQSLADLLDAVNDPERNAKRALSTVAQGLVPASGLMRNIAYAVDPTVRQPEGAIESMQAIVPGASKSLPPKLGRFGQEIQRPGGPLRRGFLIPEISTETNDPIAAALDRLGVTPQVPRVPRLILNEQRVQFTRDQETAIVRAIGEERRRRLERIVTAPGFARLSERAQKAEVQGAIRAASDLVEARVRARMRQRLPVTFEELTVR